MGKTEDESTTGQGVAGLATAPPVPASEGDSQSIESSFLGEEHPAGRSKKGVVEESIENPEGIPIDLAEKGYADPKSLEDDAAERSFHATTTTVERGQSHTQSGRPSAEFPRLSSRVSIDTEGNVYPEGGFEAYSVVFGSFCALVGSLGVCNTIGSIHAWISEHHLKGHGDGAVGWIFGVYAFLLFFGGLQIGPVFDAKGPKFLVLAGSIMLVASMILLGFCQQYWHFMLAFSVLGGIGSSLVFTPAVASSGHFFYRLRGRATGMAATGGSIGGVVFPLMLDALFPKVGFAWATRAVALICLVTLSLGCVLIKSRLPKKRATKENILPDFRIFKEVQFTLTTAGIFCIEWGLFIPITYISSYGIYYGMPRRLSYQLLAILNAGSFFGRLIPGYTADYMGRFNTMILTVLLCLLTNTCLWLPANGNLPMMVAYAFIFGFASGSNISLTPVCVGQICKTEHYGRYYATAYTIVSFGTLTGTPIAGSILTRNGGEYWGLIAFTSCCYFVGLFCFAAARVLRVGWSPWVKY